MCIGVPMPIESGDAVREVALFEGADRALERKLLEMLIIGAQPPGTWVLASAGAARRVLDPSEARRIGDALAALQLALAASDDPPQPAIDALFADRVGRSPQLPEHLRR